MDKEKNILIADDDHAVCRSLELLLRRHGYQSASVQQFGQIENAVLTYKPDLVLLDMNFTIDTSGRQGLRALEILQRLQPGLPVVLITGWATVQLAVEGMKKGARDFIAKPWDNAALLSSISTIFAMQTPELHTAFEPDESIIGESPAVQQVLAKARQIAKTDASVLITGESGTGKELLAEAIHQHSKRHLHLFVKVNLGGISATLFESEMFGHKKGAFTGAHADRMGRFEKAEKGTIFLDEIGELDMASQVKLLRVLQEKTYEVLGSSTPRKADCRVICATNRDLTAMIAEGLFREDLYYRINLIHLHIPPLRERRDDIPLLVRFFSETVCHSYGLAPVQIVPAALDWLRVQEYPGNIRQLKNLVERTILLNMDKPALNAPDFQEHFHSGGLDGRETVRLPEAGQMTLEALEIEMIKKTLEFHRYSIAKAAKSLGITRSSLYRRLDKYQIPYDG